MPYTERKMQLLPQQLKAKTTIHSLQAGRAIAAFLVLWFHLSGAFGAEKYFNTNFFKMPLNLGMLGVLYFFVLSGFLITHIHGKDVSQPTQFVPYVIKRAIRIYPIYWLVFAFSLAGILKLSNLPDSFDFSFGLAKALWNCPRKVDSGPAHVRLL